MPLHAKSTGHVLQKYYWSEKNIWLYIIIERAKERYIEREKREGERESETERKKENIVRE